ncbi:ABC transporter ATP-binding protein [Clostridium culturomicium]|uniref:ABC transporter ATP-binding protein n=1 Tax=Clostridium culturomicium TaxID=1499683 RepID=UPI003857C3FA
MENILEIRNLTKKYKNFKLDDISFVIPKGFIMGFIGENGAGKTTTIKLIMNILQKDAGEIKVFGKENVKHEREIKERIGFVYDDCFYYENLSIRDNGKIIAGFYKAWDWNVFNKYLRKFNLDDKQKVKELSKGMKMKFAIAIALSHKAEFIILDEPTSGLDPVMRRQVLEMLQQVMEDENVGMLISSHITSDLERIADYITYIKNGKIVFSMSIPELQDEYVMIKGNKNLLREIDRNIIYGLIETPYGFEGITREISKIESGVKKQLVIEKPSIEEIMVAVNKGAGK